MLRKDKLAIQRLNIFYAFVFTETEPNKNEYCFSQLQAIFEKFDYNIPFHNMHPDSLKSVVYRSFVTCDDPKGVVECGTIRKSKSSSQKMKNNIKSQEAKISYTSFSSKAEKKEEMVSKGITEELLSPSTFQLLEVSRGAQKLNQMIDAWSKGKSFDGQSKDVAKDLLKGALDLQESLMMLGKLQEASQYMAWLKKKQKEKSDRRRNDETGIERANSYHFGERNDQMGFQKPRLSADGSSRDCFEELRTAIKDSLDRQNLLPKTNPEENTGFHQRYLDSASDIASTSSSQSSITHTNNYSSTVSPHSSATPEKKPKSPNLIAKLMGLEEIPTEPLQKQLKNEKISSQQRPMFDFEMRKAKKPQSIRQHEKPEHRTLKEILETVHFTGLLKSNSVKELKSYPRHFSDSHAKQSLIGNSPPIVLIRPLRGQVLEAEQPFASTFPENDVQDAKMMSKDLKVKEEFPSKRSDQKENFLKSGKMSRKTETEENPNKRLSKEEGAKESRKVAEKPEEVKNKQNGSNKKNASGQVTQQPQRKEAIDKKADENSKAMVTSRKSVEKEIEESKNVSRSRDQVKASATKVKKPENGSNVTKNKTRRQRNSTTNPTSNHTKQTVKHNLNDRKRSSIKKEKPVREPTAAKSTRENIGSTEDDKKCGCTCESDSVLKIGFTCESDNDTCVDQLPAKEEAGASEFPFGEHCNKSQSSLNDAVLLTLQCVEDPEFVEEVNDDISSIRTDSKSFKSKADLKWLLSGSAAFLSRAEELFNLNVNCPTSLQISGIDDNVVINRVVYMDIANELIERLSLPDSKMVHPLLLTWLRNSRICISLDKLLEEVSNGVKILESYSKVAGETANLLTDSIYAMLEKDVRCKGVVSGIWDLGWRNEFSAEDTEQVVDDIEKLLLSGLIDEIIT